MRNYSRNGKLGVCDFGELTVTETGAFRLGDIRGLYPEEINEDFVRSFAHVYVGHHSLSGRIATGRDMRQSSASLHEALNEVLASIGIEVLDMGACPTELGYFASGQPDVNAAIIVTASHTPSRFNGLKCVLSDGTAMTRNAVGKVAALMQSGYKHGSSEGSIRTVDLHSAFVIELQSRFHTDELQQEMLALNGLNGTALTLAEAIADEFSLPVTWFREGPGPIPQQGTDPSDPLLAGEMKANMSTGDYLLGFAWDGDCDRFVCFDDEGNLVPTYYLIGIIAEYFLCLHPGSAIVFDTKLCWNTLDVIRRYGGQPVAARTGHTFMKLKMQESGALYGGELSAHHYFGDFHGCDSGMLAWLTVLKLLKTAEAPIKDLVAEIRAEICCTPEVSLPVSEAEEACRLLVKTYGEEYLVGSESDGIAFELPGDWRFSARASKTESALRVNFESRGYPDALLERGSRVLECLTPMCIRSVAWQDNWRIQ